MTNGSQSELLSLLEGMLPLQEKEDRERERRRHAGGDFNVAAWAVREREVPLNRIIGELLDPRGSHGQGATFLSLFLQECLQGTPIGDLHKWRLVQNLTTRHGRLVD